MTIAILDLRFYANTTHGSTTYFVRAEAPLLIVEAGRTRSRLLRGWSGRGAREDDARHILRVWQTDEDDKGMAFGQV